ncbi:conserved Plasmodium protein, unknown function [Plasmodium gallinaceum]|uniref:Uncharacterized protein n=1 Tax=Plasmodium gallinaceum TaxID=5849 RepID=A0A1J1GTG1_PLAGA|nr:conserved Plasmodium protein, unknown function [Plasmodium gallinaceum]CRG94339.1 conserved Plasmodium protein, unknown function [Plasmodium gallinaceum]
MQYNLEGRFQFISNNVFCFLIDNYICFLDLIKNEKKYLCIISNDNFKEVLCESNNSENLKKEIKIKLINTLDEKVNHTFHIKNFFCNKQNHSLVLVINKNFINILYFITFDTDDLNTFDINFTKEIKSSIKDIILTNDNIFVLLKREKNEKDKRITNEIKLNSKEDNLINNNENEEKESTGNYSNTNNYMNVNIFNNSNLKYNNKEYFVYIFELLNKKEVSLKKVFIPNASINLKKIALCPYDESKIIFLSKKSIVYSILNKNSVNLKNVNASKELIFNNSIITTIWIDFYIFIICFENNKLLFLNFSNNSRHFLCFKCFNNYSKITSLFYKQNYLFISFKTREIICFKINYDLIPLHIFKKVNSIEGNYINVKCLFKKNKIKKKNINNLKCSIHNNNLIHNKNDGELDLVTLDINTNNSKNKLKEFKNKDINTRGKNYKNDISNTYKNTFNNILNEINELENKLNSKNCNLLKTAEDKKTNNFKRTMSSNTLRVYNAYFNSDLLAECNYDSNNNKSIFDFNRLKKKKKKKFSNFNYDEEKVIDLLDVISIINLQKYLVNEINSFYIFLNYLFILLDSGLLYYTKNFDENNFNLQQSSNFYFCSYYSLSKIIDIKIKNSDIYTLDNLYILKNYSLKNNELNIICTNKKIKSFNCFSILEGNICIFLSLIDGSFYFINMSNHKILLYNKLENFFKKKALLNKHIEFSFFNKLNEYIHNGYFKIGNYFIYFFLIYSLPHEKLFIYFIYKINIKKFFRNIEEGLSIKKKDKLTYFLPSFSIYKNDQHDYFCFLVADESLRNFYFFFIELTDKEDLNKTNKINIFFCPIRRKNIVYGKIIGNYLIIIDYFFNIFFFYIKYIFSDYTNNTKDNNFILIENKENFVYRIKNKSGYHKESIRVIKNDIENTIENFFLKRRKKKKRNNNLLENKKKIEISIYTLELEEISFHLNINNEKLQFINERIVEKNLCYIDIITKGNVLITFSFNCFSHPFEIMSQINMSFQPYLEKINSFYQIKIKNKNYYLFLNKKKKYLHLKENVFVRDINKVEDENEKKNENSRIILNDNFITTYFNNVFTKNYDEKIFFSLNELNESFICSNDINFCLKNFNINFFKINATLCRKEMHNKKKKFFFDIISPESNKEKIKKEKLENKISSNTTNFFFDSESIIFTFLNENNYDFSFSSCLKNYKNKFYLYELNKKEREEKEQVNHLRNQLKELINENNKNTCVKLERSIFFFDKKHINESEILINEFEKIKRTFEKQKKEKEKIIKKLEYKCNILNEIDILYGFNKKTYIANVYKKKNPDSCFIYKNKIKFLRFLQIKEQHFLQNVEKNNVLFFLKTQKDYIDRYLEDFSSIFFIHYYPCTNINLNFLYSNLFNPNISDNDIDNVQWNYLLYYPYELFTNSRKRIQCYVLQILMNQQRKKFHTNFLNLKEEKKNYLKEINFLSNKLKLCLEEIEKYMTKSFSHMIDINLFKKDYIEKEKNEVVNTSNIYDEEIFLKIQLNKLKIENENKYNSILDENEDNNLYGKKYNEFFNLNKEINKTTEKDIIKNNKNNEKNEKNENDQKDQNCENIDSENLDIYQKKKNDIRNKIIDIKNYIYQINEQCEEFNKKLKLLQKKKYNIHKLIMLHEFYCISIYAILKNEENKFKILENAEKKQKKVEILLRDLCNLINNMNLIEIDNELLQEKKKLITEKYNNTLKLQDLLIDKKKNFEKKFIHECMNFDVLVEQKYENVIGYDFDSKKNIFLKKKIIQKHILDFNQIMIENFELQQNITDVKYLKQNCEFLSSDINNIMNSLEKKKNDRESIFKISEHKLREQINNMDTKISATKTENIILKENMQSLIKEINEIGLKKGNSNFLLKPDYIEFLKEDDEKVEYKEVERELENIEMCEDKIIENKRNEKDKESEENKNKLNDKVNEEKKKIKILSTKDIYNKSVFLKKKYK